jgi:hypothetical protein
MPEDRQSVNGMQEGEKPAEGKTEKTGGVMPQVTFATFILSLNQSALVNLGIVADPGTGQRGKNLPLAKQTIDILAMLEEKTKGNLAKEEERMLTSFLYDLRIMYVKESG